jgi:hypothetical protein|nr:MAG TPA: hypothetical protein [Caudoviricetes sp.]
MKEKLQSIYNALNSIQVSGKTNCAIVAGVMNVIEELFVECENYQPVKQEEGNTDG